MVYDDAGNFVDGQHRRANETVSEGDELELDSGSVKSLSHCY